jgi:hypothetical protein
MRALKLVCRRSSDAGEPATRRRHSKYAAAIRTLTVAVPYDSRLRDCDWPYSWPGLRSLRIYAPTFAYDPKALRDVLVRCGVDAPRKGCKGIKAVLFTDCIPVEAGISWAERERMEDKHHDIDVSMVRKTLETLGHMCPHLTALDLGPAMVYEDDLDYFRGQSERGTKSGLGATEARRDRKRPRRDCVSFGAASTAATAAAANTGSRRNAAPRPKKPTLAARRAARPQNPFSALKKVGVLIHPTSAGSLVALVRHSVTDLTLRLIDENDEEAVIEAIATVAGLGAQLRRFVLQRYGYPLSAADLRPLRKLSQLRALHVSFEEGPSGYPAFREDDAATDTARLAATDDAWCYITARMRHLQHLSVRLRDCLTPRTFRVVGEQCRQLVTLSLDAPCDFCALGDASLEPVFPALLELRVNSAGLAVATEE